MRVRITRHRRRVIQVVLLMAVYAAAMSIRPELKNVVWSTVLGVVAAVAIGLAMLIGLQIARQRGGPFGR